MNKTEIRPLLLQFAETLRAKSFDELLVHDHAPIYSHLKVPSGTEYEIQVFISRNIEFEEDCGSDRLLEITLDAYLPEHRERFWRRTACVSFDYFEKDGPTSAAWVPHFP